MLLHPGSEMARVRELFGLGDDRLREIPSYAVGEGSFAFAETQPGSDAPVGYSPCRAIPYVVNPEGAPEDWGPLIRDAVESTSRASGLEFDYQGESDARPGSYDDGFLAGDPPPVLVAWAAPAEVPDLEGDVVGLGGSASYDVRPGLRQYATGVLTLDRDQFDVSGWIPGAREPLEAVVLHELGHLVGLAHVDDTGELMHPTNTRTTYGPGDLEGLARLGDTPCH
ncbi:matrixin family metalloprotease [Nocardioides sp. P5_C9_2]